jgi:hypothetical protein
MSDTLYIQFVECEPQAQVRRYTFHVLQSGEARDFSLTISNEAFESHRARYQDGPDICTLRLRRELSDCANPPVERDFQVSDSELDDYRESHLPKSIQSLYPAKPRKIQ